MQIFNDKKGKRDSAVQSHKEYLCRAKVEFAKAVIFFQNHVPTAFPETWPLNKVRTNFCDFFG